jgi:hypothetical protein
MHIHAEVVLAQRLKLWSPSNIDSVGIKNRLTQGAPVTWVDRVRRARDFAMLSECTYGVAVSQDEISAGCDVIRCKRTGCETQWVGLTYLLEANMNPPTTLVSCSIHRAWICDKWLDW